MGLFLSAAGIANSTLDEVVQSLGRYAANHNLDFGPASVPVDEQASLYLAEGAPGHIAIRFPFDFMEWEDASQHLSSELKSPVFAFHIHDGDLWMYRLFHGGEEIDRFNPMPEYWGELPDEERASWNGDAASIARHWPAVTIESIDRYLIRWNPARTDYGKAYDDDEYPIGTDWQLVDFMKKLGLRYPEDGEDAQNVYLLSDRVAKAPPPSSKPWWKLW